MSTETDIEEFFTDLDAGVFAQKLARALSDVAASVVDHEKKGKVSVTLDFKHIPNSHQVTIDHTLNYTRPTANGEQSEKNTTTTPLHVGKGGRLSFFQENQNQLFTKDGTPNREKQQ